MKENTKKILMVVGVLALVVFMFQQEPKEVKKTATVQVQNTAENGNYALVHDEYWVSQTFRTTTGFTVESVGLMVQEENSPFNLHVEIAAVTANGSNVIAVGNLNTDQFDSTKQVVYVTMADTAEGTLVLEPNSDYRLQINAWSTSPDAIRIYYSNNNPYADGFMALNWNPISANDMYFEILSADGQACECSTANECCDGCNYMTSGTSCTGGTCDGAGTCVQDEPSACEVTFNEFVTRSNAWVSCGSDPCGQ